jgi:hypothetical protein
MSRSSAARAEESTMYRRKRHSSVPPPEIEHSDDEDVDESASDVDMMPNSSPLQFSTLVRTPTRPRGPRDIGSPSPIDALEYPQQLQSSIHRQSSPSVARTKKAPPLYDGLERPPPRGPGASPRKVSGQKRGALDEFESPPSVKKHAITASERDVFGGESKMVASSSLSSSSSATSREEGRRKEEEMSPPLSGPSSSGGRDRDFRAIDEDEPDVMMKIDAARDEV